MEFILEYLCYFFILVTIIYYTSRKIGISQHHYKYQELDGLRGICAAFVCIFHLYWRAGGAADNYWSINYINSSIVKHAIYLTGELPVGLFFMLSGFLFFKKALDDKFNLKEFIVSRFLRIYPPVIITLLLIYILTIPLSDSPQLSNWSWFLSSLPFIFTPPGSTINGTSLQIATSGVFWTLVWELRLYFAIPFMYLIMKRIKHKAIFIIIMMVIVLFYSKLIIKKQELSYIMYFLCGFLLATIKYSRKPSDMVCIILLLLAVYFTKHAYNTTTPLYMMVVFYIIKNGFNLFGLLTCLPIRYLGTCSFSLYLIHGICQTVSKHFLYDGNEYIWKVISLITAGVLAPLMYKLVESRSIYLSSKLKTVKV
ncbi:acyltransferase [Enterobacteriaceae bacterium G50]|nr:acyltransferase [Enterobacteriaceae bacterium G50]